MATHPAVTTVRASLAVLLGVTMIAAGCDSGEDRPAPPDPPTPTRTSAGTSPTPGRPVAPDDLAAALRDARPGDTVTLGSGATYEVSDHLDVPDRVSVLGQGATVVFQRRHRDLLTLGSGSRLQDLTIRSTSGASTMVRVEAGASDVALDGVALFGTGEEHTGLIAGQGSAGLHVTGSRIADVRNAVQLTGQVSDVLVDGLRIDRWQTRGIRIQGTGQNAASDVTIRAVRIGPNVGSGPSRYPIIAASSGRWHRDITVEDSVVTGRGTAFDDPEEPGSADAISITKTRGVVVRGNRSVDAGERGINVSAAEDVLVEDNLVSGADTCGIGIGASGAGKAVTEVTVRENRVLDNGRSRMGTTADASLAGIRVTQVEGGEVVENALVSGEAGQKYGIALDQARTVFVDRNTFEGPMSEIHYVDDQSPASEHE